MDVDCDTKENVFNKVLKRPPKSPNEDFVVKKSKRRDPNDENFLRDHSNIHADSFNGQVTEIDSAVSLVLDEVLSKVSDLSDSAFISNLERRNESVKMKHCDKDDIEVILLDDGTSPVTASSSVKKDKKPHSYQRKLSEEEKAIREQERLRKAEERRLKLEKAAAIKQLRQKQKEEAAEARRIEKEKKEREREEHKRMLEEKRKAEEELKRQRELKKKEEEERREQRRKEEEERREQRRLEEEERKEKKRREEEAEEMRKKRISSRFMSFFSKKERTSQPVLYPVHGPFLPFQIKDGMTVAPIHRRPLLSAEDYAHLLSATIDYPYLSRLPRRSSKLKHPLRAKLFQFHDNYRPPYYGTWRKRSAFINGRRPFAKDDKLLDYEVDSDEEWEEEDGDADDCDKDELLEDDEKDENDSEDEDGFFVDHGYLSAGEGDEDDESHGNSDRSKNSEEKALEGTDDDAFRKNRLKAKAAEWKENVDQKVVRVKKLRPTLYGPVFGPETPSPIPSFLQLPMLLWR